MEECGKVDLLSGWIAGELLGFQQDTKKLERALASHEAKNVANAYMLELSEEERLARQRKDWKGERDVFTRVKREFHEKSNRAKNAALYVDIKGGTVTTPQGSITANMVAEIGVRNERYLGLMQQSVRTMSKWCKDPAGTKETLNQLHERIEQLRKEMPDDPYRVMQVVDEIAAQAKKLAKSGKKS